jgi:hypothetical protein
MQSKKVEVGDPSMQHLKFQRRQLAKYHAPPGVLESTTFRGNAMCEKYFLMSLNAHSTLTLPFDTFVE